MDEIQEVEKFLLDFTEMYNIVNEDIKSPRVTEAIAKFRMDYCHIINKNIDLLSILDREFADDSQMYILVLSALFYVTNDIQMLDQAEELLLLDQLPLGTALRIRGQIAINRFSGNFPPREYSDARELQLHLLRRLERELDMAWDWIPYEERNHNLIFLETDTLFVEGHAPSRIVMGMYHVLKYELGYDVFVLVDFLRMDMDDMENYWAFPYRAHYSPELDGDFEVEFDGKKVRGFQQVVWGNDFSPILKVASIICEMKPEFIWHIGGDSVFSDLLGKITTLVSMPCNKGYSVSEADVLLPVGERGANVENFVAERAYIAQKGQRTYVMKDCFQLDTPGKRYDKSSFDLGEEDFAIAIVGNRLDDEIDGAFIQTMEEIARKESRCRFLMIGKYKKDFSKGILKDRVKKLGYQEDLAGVLQMTDLFLNPVRSGGGISAVMALSVGVPVITLPEGDVALNAGDGFVCSSLEEIPDLVWRYCHDPAFYCGKVEECRRRTEELLDANPAEECRKMAAFVSGFAREEFM